MSTVTLTARRQLLLAAIPLGVPPGNTTLRHSCASERLNRSPARTRNVREQRPRAYPTPRQLFSLKTSPFGCDVGVKTSTFRGCEPADLPLSPLPCPHSNGRLPESFRRPHSGRPLNQRSHLRFKPAVKKPLVARAARDRPTPGRPV